ncbi:hypothetical protein [Pseudomonas sp. 1928-m]|uniref:hypothetical protein n=1 Tax=Pseudomonas sp. 1928-m TaxID=3033804 RepID=UPI0023DF9BCC|nr:hypothetical protein [Pseudomonas sp. 1928-m]MDF3195043.1 hypothetical protein [Pseudomonas sp. 1928-m]
MSWSTANNRREQFWTSPRDGPEGWPPWVAGHKKSGERLNLRRRKVQLGATKQNQGFPKHSTALYREVFWRKPSAGKALAKIAWRTRKTPVLKSRTASDDRYNPNANEVALRLLFTPDLSKAQQGNIRAVADGVR